MTAKLAGQIAKGTVKCFFGDKVLRLSAALAYYAIFSLGPLLFMVITLAGFVFGAEAVRGTVHEELQGFIGDKAAETVESMMVAPKTGKNIVVTVLGIITLLIGATGLFGQMQDALNTIWEVQAKPGRGLKTFIRQRFLSLAMILGIGFLLLISMVVTTAVESLTMKAGRVITTSEAITNILSIITSFSVVTLLFAAIFKFLPDVRIPWRFVWHGALGTAVLFTAGRYLLSMYLGKQATSSSYGAAGSVAVILLWIYYSSVILFFGAEFTKVYAAETKGKVKPAPYAELITREARRQQGIHARRRKMVAKHAT
jgi:membrane protein